MKSKRNQRRGAASPKNKHTPKSTPSNETDFKGLAAQFTDEQKAAMIEGARIAFAQPKTPFRQEYEARMALLQADILLREALKGSCGRKPTEECSGLFAEPRPGAFISSRSMEPKIDPHPRHPGGKPKFLRGRVTARLVRVWSPAGRSSRRWDQKKGS